MAPATALPTRLPDLRRIETVRTALSDGNGRKSRDAEAPIGSGLL